MLGLSKQSTYELNGNKMSCRGTNIKQIWDILADLLLLVPFWIKGVGFVSWGVYLQGKSIYNKTLMALHMQDRVYLNGHSLGAGNCLIVAILLLKDNYKGQIEINAIGGVKCLSKKAALYLKVKNVRTTWRVRHRDPVPHIGPWKEPMHNTPVEGDQKTWFFDYSMQEHVKY